MAAIRRMRMGVALSIVLTTTLSLISIAESECTIGSLRSCYRFIGQSGSTEPPPSGCCRGLENMLQTQPICLCNVLNIDGINQTRVLAVPKACNLQTPPLSLCQAPPHAPPPSSGYSTKISHSLLLLLAALSCAGIFRVI